MIHPDTPHDPWFGRQRYTMIHLDHVVDLVCAMCTHRSSQASYIDRIWFTESIIHHIKSYIYTSCHYYGFPCWSTWNVARSRWRTPCEANHHQPHPRHGSRQRCGRMEQWIDAGWMMLVFSEQQFFHQHTGAAGGQTVRTTLRQIVGACPRSRMRLKLRQLHSGNFQQYTYTILYLSNQYQLSHGGQQQLQLDVLRQQLQSGLDLLVQKDGFELASPEKTSCGQQLIEILDRRQLQTPSLHCVLDR